ncbi:MAG: hypothetical protein KAT76_04665 [Bacteroidales bacterium]|nr:hypothetical protein [Bacteroidales bacterium]
MKKEFLLCFLTLIFFIPAIRAQDTITEITIKRIYTSKHPQDPEYPQFVIFSKSNNFQMGFGGYIRLTGAFDFNGIVDSYDFITYDIPVENRNLSEKRICFDAHQSRIYTEILGNITGDPIRFYLEADFYSDHYYPRIRHAYGQYKGFLIGQTWTTMMDLDATPNTVDFEGPNSSVALRTPMIRYTLSISNAFKMMTSLELPEVSMTYNNALASSYQYVPDVILVFRFQAKRGHLQAGGVFRTMAYADRIRNDQKTIFGGGAAISGLFKLTKKDNFMFQGVIGKGMAKYIQDISGVGLDAAPGYDKYNGRNMIPIRAGGLYFGYQHYWCTKLNSTLVYGFTKVHSKNTNLLNQDYRLGQYASINLFWNILPSMRVAMEYLWGQRKNNGGENGNANRFNGMVQFNF